MPITLPTTTTPQTTQDGTNIIQKTLQTRVFRPLDLSSTRGKSAAAIVLPRGICNFVFFVLVGMSKHPSYCLWNVVDQLVVMWAVSFVVDVRGGRRVPFTGVWVSERFFDLFLIACAVAHLLYGVFAFIMVVSLAILFGMTGWSFMFAIGAAILPVAWLASRPEEEDEARLTLP